MTTRKKLVVISCTAAVAIATWRVWPYAYFTYVIDRSLHEQGVQNEAAKPLLEAVVTEKLKIGDSLERVKEVLNYAGLPIDVRRTSHFPPRVQSVYRAGRGCGYSIDLELDSEDRVTKIDIHEFFTGP